MLQQSTLSISAHQSNQDASFAESDSKDLLQQHDATSSCCPSSSSSCSTTDTFSTGRRSRIGGNDNSVVRAISPEGRRYLKPVNGIQAKGFARSAQRRSSVLTLGSIERLQHFYAKRDLKVNKVGILGFKNSNNTTTTTSSVPEEEDDDDLLPEPSTPPRPSWLDLDVETDLDVLLGQCFHDIQSTLSAWSMVSNTAYASSELSDSEPSSDNEGSEYHIASLAHSVSRTIESIRNYTLHRNDLADSALVKLRHAAIHLLSVIREFETTHRDHAITFDGLAKEREAILRYLGVVEEYAFNPPHHIGAPPVTFSPEIKSLMHKSRSTTTTTTTSQSTRPGLPDWLDPTCFVNDNMGRYRALLADNRQSLQGDVHDHEPIPDPNDSEEAFLEYLADGRILCNAYNNVVKRSRRPFGFINKVHQETGRTFRAIENLRFFSAACKFRFDLMFHPFEPSEIARKTDRGLTALKPIVVAFCECVIAEFRENLEQVGKKRPLPDQSPVSTTVEKKFFASINNHPTTTAAIL
ncbi:hypothetical protein O0I10_008779 [Lichtheimia ornata]|uniref:Uncharacterized protein n=1 Tax=Lichtheimia ornata TaxID=688661 RepID=A0AAD7XWF9_9FUNG|nr:uncharacterized protein O0I10_008779 [Lichtheimia ornata]KAJ8655493.1 hypothetical protein O0I10_008779 [Lichtheimia ornata]